MENVTPLRTLDVSPENPVSLNDFLRADIYTVRRELTTKARDASVTADSSIIALTKHVTGATKVTVTTNLTAGGPRP
jgi:hypothetical protein